MTGAIMDDWRDRAATRRKRIVRVWRDTVVAALIGGVALGAAVAAEAPAARWTLLAVALAATAYAFWVGCYHYFRVIDEQEREAALWSGTIGLYAYALLFGANLVAARFGLVIPRADYATFWIVSAVTLAAFLWKRYR